MNELTYFWMLLTYYVGVTVQDRVINIIHKG